MNKAPKLKRKDITLFTISAILTIDGIAAAAAIGVQSLTWWVLAFICFAVPYALISAELGSSRPSQGGIVSWVKLAFGGRWAARTSWLYWINVALWMPAVFILMAGVMAQMFWPQMPIWFQIVFALVMTWVSVWICTVSLDVGKWIPNLGAWSKMIIVLLLGIGGITMAVTEGIANEINLSTLTPSWSDGLQFFPVIIFSLMGFDLICCASDEMENPRRDLPVSLLVAGVAIATLYLFAVYGVLVALPVEEIGLVSGLLMTFERLLAPLPATEWLVLLIGLLAQFSFMANIVTWSMGSNRAAAEAAQEGDLPKIFGREHPRYQTPVGAAVLTGVVSTSTILLYGLMASAAEDLYWSLFSFATLIFLLPYLMLFPAYLVLKDQPGQSADGWQLPNRKWIVYPVVLLPLAFTVQAIIFFVFPPGEVNVMDTLIMFVGLCVVLVIGEFMQQKEQPVAVSNIVLKSDKTGVKVGEVP
ncbi:APC family permease [Aestuariirhabdus sp. Z084]|uniref:APC family permease n=1 Tax=Aestuariirhabdus haliotis TaxID=2918751 RepID=UPI00201B414B|nr:APC family permease [Aestuariirhabdus haliotis]MCL6417541.1 APC family permease [Aestuariirhabdus haliotis]MCL6421484.1 APC family permease [Aestuariirhabdus haliotis]